MSSTLLEKPGLRLEQVPIRTGTLREIGISACAGCPLFAAGCPGKTEVATSCPPEAEQIKAEQVREKLFDDAVTEISSDGRGGFIALTDKAARFQSVTIVPPKPKPPVKKPVVVQKPPKPEVQPRRNRDQGFFAMLGELAAMFFVGPTTTPAKK